MRQRAIALGFIAALLAGCGMNLPEQMPTSTTDRPAPSATAVLPSTPVQPSAATPPAMSTADVREVRTGPIAHLATARMARRESSDRFVLEFTDRVPGYTIGYRPMPAHADASGEEITLPGATALVQITLSPATATGWVGGPRTYFGPSTVAADTATVTEAKAAGDFEAVLSWVVGLRTKVPFQVRELDGPPRLVIDFSND